MGPALKKLIEKLDAIISAASHSPLGIVALFLVAIFTIGLILFFRSSTRVRVAMFLAMIASGFGVFLVGLHALSPSAHPKDNPNPVNSGSIPSRLAQKVTYVGRVLDGRSLHPVQDAKADIEVGQNHKFNYTDTSGIYRITFENVASDSEARLTVTAEGYQDYNLYLPPDTAASIQPVRLESLKRTPLGTRPRRATYLGRTLDAETHSPIVGAKVTLDALAPAYTDSEGAFWFDLPTQPTGPITLTVSAKGFETYDLKLDLQKTGPIDIRLQKLKATNDPP